MFIEDSHLTIVKDILQRDVPNFEVWAFGSRVHGEHLKKFSDLDLAIISNEKIPWDVIYKLKDDFVESYLPFKVDVLDFNQVSNEFKEIIKQKYAVIQNPINPK